MTSKELYGACLIFSIIGAIVILYLRHRSSGKWSLSLKETITIVASATSGVSGCYFIYQTYDLHEPLYKLVGDTGMVGMLAGGAALIWFAFSQFKELLDNI
jgi:hypothetical protein